MYEKRAGTLRFYAIILIGVSFVAFVGLFFFISYKNASELILHSEDRYQDRQRTLISKSLDELDRHTLYSTYALSARENLDRLARAGEDSEETRLEKTLLQDYGFDFLLVTDSSGTDARVGLHNDSGDTHAVVPSGLNRQLEGLFVPPPAGSEGEARTPDAFVKRGIVLCEGGAYFVGIAPFRPVQSGAATPGFIVLGTELDLEFFQRTGFPEISGVSLEHTPQTGPGGALVREDNDFASSIFTLSDIHGDPLTLKVVSTRSLYMEGRSLFGNALLILGAIAALLGVLLFLAFFRWVLNPAVQFGKELGALTLADTALKKRLEQQELMSAMSRSFISSEKVPVLINNALQMAGEFMGVGKILLARLDEERQMLTQEYVWFDENQPELPRDFVTFPFHEGTVEYDGFISRELPYLTFDDIDGVETLEVARNHGLKALLGVPLTVSGEFWGMLSFNEANVQRTWTESDVQLVKLISSVISGVLTRSATEEKLLRMSSIVNSSPQFISYINKHGDFEYFNPAGAKTLGYSSEELQQGGIASLLSIEDRELMLGEIFPGVLEDGAGDFELELIRKDGERRVMNFSAFTTGSEDMGMGSIALDVTEKRLLEKDLMAAIEQAEQSSRAKGEFLSRMSHEMRTPLNAVIGMTSIAKASDDPEKKEYCLDKIQDASTHLLGVINDILDMSKIEANKFELSFTEFNFEKMLIRVTNVVNFRVDEKSQNLLVHLDPALPRHISSDEQRISQVIANLLSNAVKFTPERGTITVSVTLLAEEDEMCTIRVDVSDTGIGISEEEQQRLFRSFEQADGGISRKFGGTGLGLAISKSIVEMLEGEIWVESASGSGATFSFTMKARRSSVPEQGQLHNVQWSNLKILVVDDAPEVREYFLNFARTVALHCEVAADGYEACRLVEKKGAGYFNIVFADWKMPGMDGIELTRILRSRYDPEVVVFMISATQWSDIEQEARATGVDRFIPKPLFYSFIVDCINECLGHERAIADCTAPGDNNEGCFSGYRVLLVEDIEINREIVLSLLDDTGLVLDCAENGLEACKAFEANPALYDLILMDIHMPEMDGYEATRRIRSSGLPEALEIPIIAMTANVFREDIEKCLAAGMDGHVGKPINLDEILATLKRYVSRT